jgi:hypothetical protein
MDSTKSFITRDNIIEMIKDIDIADLLGDDVENKIYETLEKTGMPTEYADYVLESDEFKDYVGEYVMEGMEYILYDKELPTLDKEDTTNMLITSFDRVIDEAKKNNINVEEHLSEEQQNEIKNKIEVYTPEIIDKIPEVETIIKNKVSNNTKYQEMINQFQTMMDKIQKIYSYQSIIFGAIIIQFILIILLSFKNFKFIKNIGIPFGLNTLLLYIVNFLIPIIINNYYPEQLNFMRSMIDTMVNNIKNIWINIAIKYLVVFIIFIIMQIIVNILLKRKEQPKDMETW